ncbi:MAG TPA: hypothetical protein PKD45_04150 [Flavobacteriales bacterium]|nr:hypothetical protein [Flavobacteriales bacterium]
MSRTLRSFLATACLPLLALQAGAQEAPRLAHRAFVYWGYNRAQFTASDIRFTGTGYDFTLHGVTAKDRPEPFSLSGYFLPSNMWIPQYNYRAGWFLNDCWSLSLGLDHMKYVMEAGQEVRASGHVARERWPQVQLPEMGDIRLTPDILAYEHTDGLNLLSVDADHYDRLWASSNGQHACYLVEGLLAGPVIPRTDVRLFGEGINNKFHLAGYGVGAQLGLFMLLQDRVFLRATARAGFIHLPDVLTTGTSADRASQHFWFLQENVVLGVLIGKGKA